MARDIGRFAEDKDAWARAIKAFANENRRRITYECMAETIGMPQRSIADKYMRVKNHYNSWIVSAATGFPTGYTPNEIHPDLPGSPIITNPEELRGLVPAPRAGRADV